ncbi:hypothetical protein [Paracoccus alkenifer]|uniref:Uncharacterized protein n=1 Tax=Paracoccus alkenifer TaxID=65735 RepID=A0A1H6MZ92_9RHOB|nr:hypothetical protein [Paracoccus alkenifer]SEI07602.1 hypothetical protein SAMN04488075_2652 [Paracoccus alkenifer]
MTRLLIAAMLAALIGVPAQAQTEAAPDGDGAAQTAPAAADGDDDDDDDDDAPAAAASTVQHHDFGPSGIMTRANREDLAPLTLSSGKPVAEGEYSLQSGGYYRIKIQADGTQELALSGGDFFRAVWINEVVINDIEIRPMGVHSIEFDDAGEATISFIAIMPGRYTLSIPGSSGETQQAVFNIR